jgi:cytochrome c biogenesis protein CcmG/thiol:disulfide interchange protein DsbE
MRFRAVGLVAVAALVAVSASYIAYRLSQPDNSVQVLGGPERFVINGDLFPGERVMVNFFASWCGPCREEHPYLLELAERGKVRMVGVSVMDAPDNTTAYLEEHGNPFELVGADPNREVSLPMGVAGIPYTMLLDEKGEITARLAGPIGPERVEPLLQ